MQTELHTPATAPPPPTAGFGIVRPHHTPTAGSATVSGDPSAADGARTEVGLGRLIVAVSALERALERDDAWVDPAGLEQLRDRLAALGAGVMSARFDGATAQRIAALEAQLRSVTDELGRHREGARAQQRTIAALQDRTQQLQDALIASHRKNVLERDRSSTLEREIDLLEADLARANDASAASAAHVEAMRKQIHTLKRVIGKMRQREKVAQDEAAVARSEAASLREQLDAVTEALASTRTELAHQSLELKRTRLALRESQADLDEARAEAAIMEIWMNRALSHVSELQQQAAAASPDDESFVAVAASAS
jgi:chromosome segregation ATPase